jgi:hypothetical protein
VRPPDDGHQWYAVEDPDNDTTWMFDTTFLLSDYHCIYGDGCRSIDHTADTSDLLGCCLHGAHLVDDEDREAVVRQAALLDPDEWQFHDRANRKGGPLKRNRGGDWVTRKAEGACIFLNREGFPGGAGCALHAAALRRGQRPLDWKPDVCWQVPLHLDIHTDEYDHETVLVRAWLRRDWGPGGEDFHWWCIEDDAPYRATEPVYVGSREELVEMVGPDIYRRLAEELDRRRVETPVTLG